MEEEASTVILNEQGLRRYQKLLLEDTESFKAIVYYDLQDRLKEGSIDDYLELIQLTEELKEYIFSETLDSYNEFLKEKLSITAELNEENSYLRKYQEDFNISLQKIKLVTIIAAIISVRLALIIALISILRITFDYLLTKICKKAIEENDRVISYYQEVHTELYTYVDNMRTDYHRSKKELNDLRVRAKKGEDIKNELLRIAHPSSVGLDLIETAEEEIETPKQLIKQ